MLFLSSLLQKYMKSVTNWRECPTNYQKRVRPPFSTQAICSIQ